MIMKKRFTHIYQDIISIDNLLVAWTEFKNGKTSRYDVQQFELDLMRNIFLLENNLANKTYQHSAYHAFNIADPKPRNIHKASVRDRLLHHAIYRKLYPFFDTVFIADSFSCRVGKGTHKAISRFRTFTYLESRNHTRTCWVLKCDIKKFFASIDQRILIEILVGYIKDHDIMWLLLQIITSFHGSRIGVGLPLGNLTSQLLVNIYMNEFDQFMKHTLKAKYYIRYADDFVILSRDKTWLENVLPRMKEFLWQKLRLQMHPNKVSISTVASGADFLGWTHFPGHRVLRTSTKRRMLTKLHKTQNLEVLNSYLGLLKHGNTYKLRQAIDSRTNLENISDIF